MIQVPWKQKDKNNKLLLSEPGKGCTGCCVPPDLIEHNKFCDLAGGVDIAED